MDKEINRRTFFKQALRKTTNKIVTQIDAQVQRRAEQWIRPPFALQELDFLLACTRCDKCVDACTFNVIFSLSAKLGAQVVGTPAMDLLNKGCHLCVDWPCVNACDPGALKISESTNDNDEKSPELPYLAKVWIHTDKCLPYQGPDCGVCEQSCPVSGALEWEENRPYINPALCTGCGLCREVCIAMPKAIGIASIHHKDVIGEDVT